jgi:hypothetical protein
MAQDPNIVSEGSRFQSFSGSRLGIVLSAAIASSEQMQQVISGQKSIASLIQPSAPQRPTTSSGLSIKEALARIDAQRTSIKEKSLANELDRQFTEENLGYESYKGIPLTYRGSEEQLKLYDELTTKDLRYRQFIIDHYGSIENYITQQSSQFKQSVFDPAVDYKLDVTIVKDKKKFYKSDHISTNEVIMETLTGVCTFYYRKVDNNEGKSTGTLDPGYIPDDQLHWRPYFFSPLKNNRVVIWDIVKHRWNSFYMSRLYKFVRDDTISAE